METSPAGIYRNTTRVILWTGLAVLTFILSFATTRAEILYRETFGTATTGGQGASQGYDWAVHAGTTAVDHSADVSTVVAINRTSGASKPGTADAIGQVNAGPVLGATPAAYGTGIAFTTVATGNTIFWTPEYALTSGNAAGINPSVYSELKFSWYQGNANTDGAWRVAVRINGQWYASQTQFFNTASVAAAGDFDNGDDNGAGGGNHGSELKSFTYTTNASAWFLVNFDGAYSTNTHTGTSGTVLALGAQPGANLSGNIDAFGMFSSTPGANGNRRFDTYMIEGVPIPVGVGKPVTWTGAMDSDWNTFSLDWVNLGNSTNYDQGDLVRFDDSLTVPGNNNINLTATLVPSSVTVSNDATTYTFSGSGSVGGSARLLKQGAGTLILTSANTYSGGTVISNGMLQVGDGNATGTLGSGNVTNFSSLTFNRNNNFTVANIISGTGSVLQNGTGSLELSGTSSYTGQTVVNAGTLVVNGILGGGGLLTNAVGTTLSGRGTNTGPVDLSGTISPGTSAGTFTSGALTLESGAAATFELTSSTTVGGGVNDLIQANGNLTLNNNTANIVLLNLPQTGVPYRLINFTGTRSGSLSSPAAIAGGSRLIATPSYDDTLKQVNVTFTGSPTALTWNSASDSEWDKGTTSNWLNQASASDAFYDFDSVLFDDTTGLQPNIDIASGILVRPASIVVDSTNNAYIIGGAGGIVGTAGVLKRGPGTLTLGGVNSYSGGMNISNGAVRLSTVTAAGTGTVNVRSEGMLIAGAAHTNAIILAGGALGGSIANIASLSGDLTATASTTSIIYTADPQNPTLNAEMNFTGNLLGGGNLIVSSGGNDTTVDSGVGFRLRGTGASTFSGTITLSNNVKGELQTTVAGPFSPAGTGKIVLVCGIYDGNGVATAPASGGFSELNIRNNSTNHTHVGNNVEVVGSGATLLNLLGSAPSNAISTMGNLKIGGGQELGVIRNSGQPQTVAFQSVTLTGGNATFSPKTPGFGAATASGSDLLLSNITQQAASGVIMSGQRTLYLTGTNGYTGNTIISNGVLSLIGNSSLANSPVITLANGGSLAVTGRVGGTFILVNGQTLKGNGSVIGNMIAGAGSIVSPGDSVGTVTMTGTALLQGTTVMEIDKDGSTQDLITGAVSLTYSGTLIISNLNTALADGDNFQLFSAASYTGAFSSIVPATPGSGLAWNTNTLANDGILRVVATAGAPPQIQSITLSGTNVIITGNGGTQGNDYYVLTSTNLALSQINWKRIATNQFGAGGSLSISIPVDPTAPKNFYLLQLP